MSKAVGKTGHESADLKNGTADGRSCSDHFGLAKKTLRRASRYNVLCPTPEVRGGVRCDKDKPRPTADWKQDRRKSQISGVGRPRQEKTGSL